jgi:prepilin-type N-terminal cleavage/methylation domain-containing protein
MQTPIAASSHLRAGRSQAAGFTLIELVAALVIAGAIVAVALPIYRDMRLEARRGALEGIRATIVANMVLARAAYLTQGLGPGSTVRVNGRLVEVWGEAARDPDNWSVPAGAPTGTGMATMLGCGASLPDGIETPCLAMPGYLLIKGPGGLSIWPAATTTSFVDTACYVSYWPAAGHDPSAVPDDRDPLAGVAPWWGVAYASDWAYYPRTEAPAGGC